jgi:hypothetical protein
MSGVYVYRQDNQPFAQIPNQAIRDPRLSSNAFRLLAYLMSHKDGYKLTYDQIERQTTLGRYAINEAIKILTALGWLQVERPKKDNGQFDAKAWYVMDPYDLATVGHSTMESPHVEPPTDIKKTNKREKTNDKELTTRATVLSDDFAITDSMRSWATEKHPQVDIDKATLNFVDYWKSKPKDNKQLDWTRTWQRWIRTTRPEAKARVTREEENKKTIREFLKNAKD